MKLVHMYLETCLIIVSLEYLGVLWTRFSFLEYSCQQGNKVIHVSIYFITFLNNKLM